MQAANIDVKPALSAEMQANVFRLYQDSQQSEAALAWLDQHGFVPVSFIAGRARKPIIEIEHSPHALTFFAKQKGFKTYAYIIRHSASGREYVMRATVFGCFVQWIERGN